MSGAADHGKYRKVLLLSFAFTGAIATMLFITVTPSIYIFGAILAIISNTCFGASFVLLNSFLPLLVRHHPLIHDEAAFDRDDSNADHSHTQREGEEDAEEHHLESSTAALLPPAQPSIANKSKEPGNISPELVLSTQISSYGIGIGYIAAVVVQSLAIAILLLTRYLSKSTTLGLRLVLLFVGSWWLLFTVPSALWLRPRPGPPYVLHLHLSLPLLTNNTKESQSLSLFLESNTKFQNAIHQLRQTTPHLAEIHLLRVALPRQNRRPCPTPPRHDLLPFRLVPPQRLHRHDQRHSSPLRQNPARNGSRGFGRHQRRRNHLRCLWRLRLVTLVALFQCEAFADDYCMYCAL